MWQQLDTISNNWITVVLFLTLIVLVQTYRLYPFESKFFIRFFEFDTYLRIYSNDRETSQLDIFQFVLLFLSLISSSFLIFFGFVYVEKLTNTWQNYFGLIFVLATIIAVRYLILKLLLWLTDLTSVARYIIFKNISLQGQFSLNGLLFITLYVYSPIDHQSLIKYGLPVLVLIYSFFQIYTYSTILVTNFKSWIYIILYFCAFKILPWIWVAERYQLL